jgi:hypothetical protein
MLSHRGERVQHVFVVFPGEDLCVLLASSQPFLVGTIHTTPRPLNEKRRFLKLECLAYKNHAKEFLKLYLKCPYGSDASSGLLQR